MKTGRPRVKHTVSGAVNPLVIPLGRCTMNADDRQAILDLISSYSYAYDANDLERFGGLFEANAVATFRQGNLTGNAQIREAMAARRQWVAQQGIQPRHYQTNTMLAEIAEGHVKGTTMILVTWQRSGEPEPRVVHTGFYDDEFRRTAEGWRFSKRAILIDHENL